MTTLSLFSLQQQFQRRFAPQFFMPQSNSFRLTAAEPADAPGGSVFSSAGVPDFGGTHPGETPGALGEVVTNSRGETAIRTPDGSIINPEGLQDVSSPSWFDLQRIAFVVIGVLLLVVGLAILAAPSASNAFDFWTKYETARAARKARKSGFLDGPDDTPSGGGDAPPSPPPPPPPSDPRPGPFEFANAGDDKIEGGSRFPELKPVPDHSALPELNAPIFSKKSDKKSEPERGRTADQIFADAKKKAAKAATNADPVTEAVQDHSSEWAKAARDAVKATTKAGPIVSTSNAPIPKPTAPLKPARKTGGGLHVRGSGKPTHRSVEGGDFSIWGRRTDTSAKHNSTSDAVGKALGEIIKLPKLKGI